MSEQVRMDVKLRISQTTFDTIERLAAERNLPRTGLVLQAIGLLQVIHDAKKDGRHIGLTPHRENLETVLVAL